MWIYPLLALIACGGEASRPVSPPPPPGPATPAPVTSVTVEPSVATLVPQQSLALAATPRNAAGSPLSGRVTAWSSTAQAVASVSTSGLVTALSPGTATIIAAIEGQTGTAIITVQDGGFVGATGGNVLAANGAVVLEVPPGALPGGLALAVATTSDPPPHPRLVAGTAYMFGPNGTAFTHPVTVRIRYDQGQLPAGANQDLLAIHRWSGAEWEPLAGSTVDLDARRVSGQTVGFSNFAVIEQPERSIPIVRLLIPDKAIAGGPRFTLTVKGERFADGAEVHWNGSARTTTFISETELQVEIAAGDIAVAGLVQITVVNAPSAGGASSEPAAFTVTVLVEFRFCSAGRNPIFFAYQDGFGDWTPVAGTLENGEYTYRFGLSQDRGGVYYVAPSGEAMQAGARSGSANSFRPVRGWSPAAPHPPATTTIPDLSEVFTGAAFAGSYVTDVWYLLTTQFREVGIDLCRLTSADAGSTVFVPYRSVPTTHQAAIALGGRSFVRDGAPGMLVPVFQANGIRSGMIDLVGSRSSKGEATWTPDRVVKLNDLEPAPFSTVAPIADFLGADSWDAASVTVNYDVVPGTEQTAFTRYYTRHGLVGELTPFGTVSTNQSRTVFGFPSPAVRASEVHEIYSFFRPQGAQTNDEFRIAANYLGALQSVSQNPLDPIANLQAIPVDPTARLFAASADVPPEADRFLRVQFAGGGGTVIQSVLRSAEYLAGGPTAGGSLLSSMAPQSLEMPDLSALEGLPPASLLPAGEVAVTMEAGSWSGATRSFLFPANPPVGLRIRHAFRTIRIMAP